MINKLKLATVGAGYFSWFQYDAWERISDVELVAICNRTPDAAREIAKAFGIPEVFTDLEEMIKTAKPDFLDVITPPETHLHTIQMAAQHGVNVICQKPFCTNLETARQAADIAEKAGIKLVIHENFRFQPWYSKIRDLINSDAIGTPYQVMFRLRPGDGQGADAYLERQPYFQTMERFLVHETGIHLIDTFRFLFGEVTAVYADLRKLNPVISGEDAGTILFDFEQGTRGLFDANRLVDHCAVDKRLTMGEMLVEGSKGVLRLDGDGTISLREQGKSEEEEVPYDWDNQAFGGDCVFLLQRHIVNSWLNDTKTVNTATEYLRNLEIEEAIYQSSSEGQKISV